jgi:hypothetical protein
MSNAYRVAAGNYVLYLPAHNSVSNPNDTFDVRWRSAYVVSVTDQSNLVLAVHRSDGSFVNLNAGEAVPKRTAHGQTNVWRPY